MEQCFGEIYEKVEIVPPDLWNVFWLKHLREMSPRRGGEKAEEPNDRDNLKKKI